MSDDCLRPPHGFEQMIEVFGDIRGYIRSDGTLNASWERDMLVPVAIPFKLPLSWAPDTSVSKVRCHKLIAGVVGELFYEALPFSKLFKSYGGCFAYRPMRRGGKLSTHAWGIAFDLNVRTNQPGTKGDMPIEIVDLFRRYGFKWGGDWSGKNRDPMHFQFVTGY